MSAALRLSWVQPEDLVGHELRQAAEDGRHGPAVRAIADRWTRAGGSAAPARKGASDQPAGAGLRALAQELLDELDALPAPRATAEPDALAAIEAACPGWTETLDVAPPGPAALRDRLHGAWLGRAAGCLLGKPVEKIPRAGIREIAEATGNWPLSGYFTAVGLPAGVAHRWPWNRRSAPTSLVENIDGMPEDDDLNYPLLALLLLERHGTGFTTADVARVWLEELPAGRTFTAERVAYRNLLDGVEPPLTARRRNPFREWIGAQIRADVLGWVHPGRPGDAARAAWRDAALTHTANGLYGAMFTAALSAAAVVLDDPARCVEAGLSVVPPDSRLAAAVRTAVRAAGEEADWERVVDRIEAETGHLHWVHVLPNAALVAAALVHGRGDFTASVTRVVAGGCDTDSNGATVGAVTGLLTGAAALPEVWTAPLRNRLASSVAGFDGTGFDTLADRTLALLRRPPGDTP
ncbi:ADP-ribosylglycohydrolase family protein [Streptomyces sp. SL13]|uniref:ADP-ribosylglycohydrolase family protein n=1 Tax=Streptantibioticus silvisoli TaxID=2705255 RepID=A0AA90H7D3_9ACTN|nr:ADP-ribosylglycohydrolase family protein [Streptantibioticus silvisoli]MDI5972325.1 ADP-ribosylglycohydrolase family protein [Streptantibioticus silvisoli]